MALPVKTAPDSVVKNDFFCPGGGCLTVPFSYVLDTNIIHYYAKCCVTVAIVFETMFHKNKSIIQNQRSRGQNYI